MDAKMALDAFRRQRAGAFARGIEWRLTFKQWADWWGDDIGRRGVGHDNLQMQRIADAGPYALQNIRKGCPRDNAKTRGVVARTRNARIAKAEIERQAMASKAVPRREALGLSDDEWELFKMFSVKSSRILRYDFIK